MIPRPPLSPFASPEEREKRRKEDERDACTLASIMIVSAALFLMAAAFVIVQVAGWNWLAVWVASTALIAGAILQVRSYLIKLLDRN